MDVLAARDDHVVDPTVDPEVAVLVEMARVAPVIGRDQKRKPGCAGRPAVNTRLRVGDEGEIAVHLSSDEAFQGYWHRADADTKTIRDGWYHGDQLVIPGGADREWIQRLVRNQGAICVGHRFLLWGVPGRRLRRTTGGRQAALDPSKESIIE